MRNVADASDTTPKDGDRSHSENDEDESSRCGRDSAEPGSNRYDALSAAIARAGVRLTESPNARPQRRTEAVCVWPID